MRPRDLAELAEVPGFGERKIQRYGKDILGVLLLFSLERVEAPKKRSASAEETVSLLRRGQTFEEIAERRGLRLERVINHVAEMVACGELEFDAGWIPYSRLARIEAACDSVQSLDRLRPIKDVLPEDYTFEEIRLVVSRRIAAAQSRPAAAAHS